MDHKQTPTKTPHDSVHFACVLLPYMSPHTEYPTVRANGARLGVRVDTGEGERWMTVHCLQVTWLCKRRWETGYECMLILVDGTSIGMCNPTRWVGVDHTTEG